MSERILIIDFGSQVTQLIARRVRESGVYSEIHPFNAVTTETVRAFDPKGVILSGGPASIIGKDTPRAPDGLFDMGIPILGICYGQMVMAEALGGRIISSDRREFGRAFVDVTGDCELFHGVWDVGSKEQVWMSHGDRIDTPPPGFRTVASSPLPTMNGAFMASCITLKWFTLHMGLCCFKTSHTRFAAVLAIGLWRVLGNSK